MCCIFTCCGWMIDLIQRAWTFAMSCCMSSAICCLMFSGSMSGIALGYNYSLAEYIDLKETNVSVYLKRGVFDDEVADDMDWRRSGHLPVAGHLSDNNLKTGAPEGEENMGALRSGRRLDDSVFDSGDHNRFEGSLMKLTAKPLLATKAPSTSDFEMAQAINAHPENAVEQIKAVQAVINRRKSNDALNAIKAKMTSPNSENNDGFEDTQPQWTNQGRRFMSDFGTTNPARNAVPRAKDISGINWIAPKIESGHVIKDMYHKDIVTNNPPDFYVDSPKYPQPIRLNAPTRLTNYYDKFVRLSTKSMDAAFESLQEKFMAKKISDSTKHEYAMPREQDEDYDARGLPIRKKRDINHNIKNQSIKSNDQSNENENDLSSLGPEKELIAKSKTKERAISLKMPEENSIMNKLVGLLTDRTKSEESATFTNAIDPTIEEHTPSLLVETTTMKLLKRILQSASLE